MDEEKIDSSVLPSVVVIVRWSVLELGTGFVDVAVTVDVGFGSEVLVEDNDKVVKDILLSIIFFIIMMQSK